MKLLSWNVCGIRAIMRKGALAPVLAAGDYDVVALQEVRCDEAATCALAADLGGGLGGGYPHVAVNAGGRKGYAGTAILSRVPFARLPDPGIDDEGRVVAADFGDFVLVTAYVTNAGQGSLERLPKRVAWDAAFAAFVRGIAKPVVLCGDFNVAREPIDVHHPERQARAAGYTDEERAGFEALLAARGLVDTFRAAHPGEVRYSYWSNFAQSRAKNLGWRIDYVLASPGVATAGADILDGAMGSDHAPVALEVRDRLPDLVATFRALKAQSSAERMAFKARAYGKVLDQLERLPAAHSKDALLAKLEGVGDSMRATIGAVFAGEGPAAAAVDPRFRALEELTSVTSIGPVRARKLVDEHGVAGVADLRAKHAAGAVALSAKEAFGLSHWEDFLLKIPRAEMEQHRATLERALAEAQGDAGARGGATAITVMGSYRRGAAESGDIDALVLGPFAAVAGRLAATGYLLPSTFGFGSKKLLGVVRLPGARHFRRLDLMSVRAEELPFALLYFTGSAAFNVRVRKVANDAGYSLSERGFRPLHDAAAARLAAHAAESGPFRDEAGVLAYLGLPYVPPEQRV